MREDVNTVYVQHPGLQWQQTVKNCFLVLNIVKLYIIRGFAMAI